jgi:hypothetical protein
VSFHRLLQGRDLHAPSSEFVENHTGSTIPQFIACSFNGIGSALPQIVPGGTLIQGITQTAIPTWAPNQGTGYITCYGILTDVNTSSFSVNDLLYSDAFGVLSTTINSRPICQVLKVDPVFGTVYVFPLGTAASTVLEVTKAGRALVSDFSGSPLKATITFVTSITTPYAVNISGVDTRVWSVESVTNTGFVINSNAALGLTGDVFWEVQQDGEF